MIKENGSTPITIEAIVPARKENRPIALTGMVGHGMTRKCPLACQVASSQVGRKRTAEQKVERGESRDESRSNVRRGVKRVTCQCQVLSVSATIVPVNDAGGGSG